MIVAFTVALAYASTNFDNLAVFFGLAPTVGVKRVAFAFAFTQCLVIIAAVAVGAAADNLPAEWIGVLGLIPIGLGLRELWKQYRSGSRADTTADSQQTRSTMAMILVFGGLSADTFALTATLLADGSDQFDMGVLSGAVIALACLTLVGVAASRAAERAKTIVEKLDRITPFIMIASGVYILSDTLTDVV